MEDVLLGEDRLRARLRAVEGILLEGGTALESLASGSLGIEDRLLDVDVEDWVELLVPDEAVEEEEEAEVVAGVIEEVEEEAGVEDEDGEELNQSGNEATYVKREGRGRDGGGGERDIVSPEREFASH